MNWQYFLHLGAYAVAVPFVLYVILRAAAKPEPRRDEDEGGPLWL